MENKFLEELALYIIKRMVTDESVKAAKEQILKYLQDLSAKTPNVVDDYIVQILVTALGGK